MPNLGRRRAKRNPTKMGELKRERKAESKAAWEAKKAAWAEKRAAGAAEREAKRIAYEARQKQLEEDRRAIANAIAAEQIAMLEAKKPEFLKEFYRQNNLPPETIYHPKYYAVGVDPVIDDQRLENICFARDWPSHMGGLGAYGHLKNFIGHTWPWIEWNPWLEKALRSLCDPEWEIVEGDVHMRFVSWVGAGAAGKTFSAGLFACAWWLNDLWVQKRRSSVMLTTTSKGILGQRVWPVIQSLFHDAKRQPGDKKLRWGRLIDSEKKVEPLPLSNDKRRDSKNVIVGMAVEPGELQGSLDKIKGLHTERMLVIIDEANSTPQAIFECIPNKLTAAREIIVLVIGNAGSRLDAHGRCCEPKKGWKSIGIEDDIWETKGVPQWGIGRGVCVHFDGAKSPNVLAGKTIHKHIYSFERWQQVQRMGEEYRNTLQHWSQDRGFWPPDGLQTTIFTEALVLSHDGMGKFTWIDSPKPCASLDTAFGGDDCVYQPGLLGMVRGPKLALQLLPPMLVPFNPDSPDSIDYQIAQWFIARCKKEGVAPELAGLDATGTGRGVAAFVQQLWSPRVVAVEFGGAASHLPASASDTRESVEVYQNRVTELWYSCRELLTSDQIKGFTDQAVKEFCSRTYELTNRRYHVEPKSKMKQRLGYSPDHADAAVVLVDVARRNGLKAAVIGGAAPSVTGDTAWHEAEAEIAALTTDSYSAANDFSAYADVN